jgi:hypothetical protein
MRPVIMVLGSLLVLTACDPAFESSLSVRQINSLVERSVLTRDDIEVTQHTTGYSRIIEDYELTQNQAGDLVTYDISYKNNTVTGKADIVHIPTMVNMPTRLTVKNLVAASEELSNNKLEVTVSEPELNGTEWTMVQRTVKDFTINIIQRDPSFIYTVSWGGIESAIYNLALVLPPEPAPTVGITIVDWDAVEIKDGTVLWEQAAVVNREYKTWDEIQDVVRITALQKLSNAYTHIEWMLTQWYPPDVFNGGGSDTLIPWTNTDRFLLEFEGYCRNDKDLVIDINSTFIYARIYNPPVLRKEVQIVWIGGCYDGGHYDVGRLGLLFGTPQNELARVTPDDKGTTPAKCDFCKAEGRMQEVIDDVFDGYNLHTLDELIDHLQIMYLARFTANARTYYMLTDAFTTGTPTKAIEWCNYAQFVSQLSTVFRDNPYVLRIWITTAQ